MTQPRIPLRVRLFGEPSQTLRDHLVGALIQIVGLTAIAAAFLQAGSAARDDIALEIPNNGTRPPAVGSPAQILAERGDDCWTTPDDHPHDLLGSEGGAVVLSGGLSTDPAVIHEASLAWYYGEPTDLPRIYGFCR